MTHAFLKNKRSLKTVQIVMDRFPSELVVLSVDNVRQSLTQITQ